MGKSNECVEPEIGSCEYKFPYDHFFLLGKFLLVAVKTKTCSMTLQFNELFYEAFNFKINKFNFLEKRIEEGNLELQQLASIQIASNTFKN